MPPPHSQKNIVHGSITANGNVHIGDITYNIERDFKSGSILFLRLDKKDETHYTAQLSVKSKHSTQGTLATSGEKWCENIEVNIPPQLFENLNDFQAIRRSIDTQMRLTGTRDVNPSSIITLENQLAQLIFDTFFFGKIGQACTDFIQLFEEQRIEELLLAVSADDERMVNLPFEMVLPLLFPPKLGEAKRSLAINNFGLVRTKMTALDTFKMQGDHATAAPLKMLFITALPENLDERGKMLQIEEEQTRLIQSIGALEATGDKKPKIVIEFLENASLDELDKALHARQHDIVHISGHGAYHAAAHKGVLYFENEDGDEEQVAGAALGETLRQHACVKLLILSACETAIAGSEGGVTEQAAEFGVPSIVAMRFAVTDEGAKVFTTELYTQLAKGLSLTRALAYAREALLKEIERKRAQTPHILHIAEWFTPVVYQNQLVGALIDKTQPYHLPDHFYPLSSFLKTRQSRLIGEGFIGRKRYLIQLRQAFRAGRHVCLHGLGGLGKTTLAEAFAHNYDNHSHATVIFRNSNQINEAHILQTLNKRFAKTNPDLAEQIQQAIDDPEPDGKKETEALLHKLQLLIDNYLYGRKTILIFDNVEDVQTDEGGAYQRSIGSESLSAFLRHLCENTPTNCHILFTTRYKIANLAEVVEHLALDKMGYAEQYRLLNYSPILRDIPLQDRDDVYKRLDGHPRGYEYLEALLKKDKTFRWQQVSAAEADVSENLLLAKVYERLTEREKAIFQMVAVFIARTPLEALAAVSGEREADLLPVLKTLQDWSLCFLEKDGRFEVHRLTREWMRENVISSLKIKEWALKAGEYFENLIVLKNRVAFDDAELANKYYELAESWDDFANTSFLLQGHYQVTGFYEKALEINKIILEKKEISDIRKAQTYNNIGMILHNYGKIEEANTYYEKSLQINKKLGVLKKEAENLSNLATLLVIKGDFDNALKHLFDALKIQRDINEKSGESITLNNIGRVYQEKEDYDTSLKYFEDSINLKEDGENDDGVLLSNLGLNYRNKGDYAKALEFLMRSLKAAKITNHRKVEGMTLGNIGDVYKELGKYEIAIPYLEDSLKISREVGDIVGLAVALHQIGVVYAEHIKDIDKAIAAFWESYKINQKIGSPNIKYPENYLNLIIEQIGEAKFQEIISKME